MSERKNKPAQPNLPRALGGHYTPPFKLVVESSMSGRDHYVKDANGLVVTYQDFERLLNTLTAELASARAVLAALTMPEHVRRAATGCGCEYGDHVARNGKLVIEHDTGDHVVADFNEFDNAQECAEAYATVLQWVKAAFQAARGEQGETK